MLLYLSPVLLYSPAPLTFNTPLRTIYFSQHNKIPTIETDFTVLGNIAFKEQVGYRFNIIAFKEQVGCRFNIISADRTDI